MTEQGQVMFGNTAILYRVVRSPRRKKSVSLYVSADGLEVRAPERMSDGTVAEIVLRKASWIVAKQLRFELLSRSAEPPRQFVDGETLRYLGRQYRLKRAPGMGVKLKGRYLEVPYAPEEDIRTALVAWYKEKAAHHLVARVEVYSRKLGRNPSLVLIRDQRKRWGSCNSKGELRFNWRIIMAPLPLLDYVVAHELCHLEHLDHSTAFWRRLGQLLPDYPRLQEQLDRQGRLYAFETEV